MLVGRALRTEQAIHERLSKKTALAVFSSDALSSVAYSTEAVLLVLLAAGTAAIAYLPVIATGITILSGCWYFLTGRPFMHIRQAAVLTLLRKTTWALRPG